MVQFAIFPPLYTATFASIRGTSRSIEWTWCSTVAAAGTIAMIELINKQFRSAIQILTAQINIVRFFIDKTVKQSLDDIRCDLHWTGGLFYRSRSEWWYILSWLNNWRLLLSFLLINWNHCETLLLNCDKHHSLSLSHAKWMKNWQVIDNAAKLHKFSTTTNRMNTLALYINTKVKQYQIVIRGGAMAEFIYIRISFGNK